MSNITKLADHALKLISLDSSLGEDAENAVRLAEFEHLQKTTARKRQDMKDEIILVICPEMGDGIVEASIKRFTRQCEPVVVSLNNLENGIEHQLVAIPDGVHGTWLPFEIHKLLNRN